MFVNKYLSSRMQIIPRSGSENKRNRAQAKGKRNHEIDEIHESQKRGPHVHSELVRIYDLVQQLLTKLRESLSDAGIFCKFSSLANLLLPSCVESVI